MELFDRQLLNKLSIELQKIFGKQFIELSPNHDLTKLDNDENYYILVELETVEHTRSFDNLNLDLHFIIERKEYDNVSVFIRKIKKFMKENRVPAKNRTTWNANINKLEIIFNYNHLVGELPPEYDLLK